jgi:hypothetical protein
MATTTWRTKRAHRDWLERLQGFNRIYETKITDGYREAIGRGATPEASEKSAQRTWERMAGHPEMTTRDLSSTAPLSLGEEPEMTTREVSSTAPLSLGEEPEMTTREVSSTAPLSLGEELREAIDALMADDSRPLKLLINRLTNDPRPEHKEPALGRARTN